MKGIYAPKGNRIRFYVEDYQKLKVSTDWAVHEVLIDFAEQSALNEIEQIISEESNNTSSMMILRFESDAKWKLFPGSWYSVDLSFFRDSIDVISLTPEDEGAAFLKYQLEFKSVEKSLVMLSPVNWGNWEGENNLSELKFIGEPWLNVVNCGQGNWNEVFFSNAVLLYDIGASRSFSRGDIRTLVDRRFNKYQHRKVVVFISHWDIDHYQALLECSSLELRQIDCLIVPSQVPNTLTYKRVKQKLNFERVRIVSLPPEPRPTGKGRKIILVQHSNWGSVTIYRAVSGSSRNQTGIVVTVEGKFRLAILAGDHHYEKVLSAISNTTAKHAVLVAPHHGGNAGRLDVSAWKNQFHYIDCPISVGKNSYNHPQLKYLSKLWQLQGYYPPRTDKLSFGFGPCTFRRRDPYCNLKCLTKCTRVNGDCFSGDISYTL